MMCYINRRAAAAAFGMPEPTAATGVRFAAEENGVREQYVTATAPVIEPGDPFQCRGLDILEAASWPPTPDYLGLEQANPGLGQPFGMADRRVLPPAMPPTPAYRLPSAPPDSPTLRPPPASPRRAPVPAWHPQKDVDSAASVGADSAHRGTLDSGAQHRSSRRVQRMPPSVHWPTHEWALAPPPPAAC